MGLTSGGLWYDGPQEATPEPPPRVPRGRAAPFLNTREKPTGEVRPLPRARNQVREPRRRRHAPARRGTRAGYARKRDPLPVGEGETMTATDPLTGGDAVRRRMTAPLPSTTAPAAQDLGSEAGIIPDGAERRSGTSNGLAPAARGPGSGSGATDKGHAGPADSRRKARIMNRALCPKRLRHMNSGHEKHDIS